MSENIWEKVGGKEGGTVSALVASPGPSGARTIWAGTMAGMFASNDNGHNWHITNNGLTSPYVQAVAVSPNYHEDKQVFTGAVNAGAFRSITAGSYWEKMEFWGTVPQVVCIAFSPNFGKDGVAFLGSEGDGVFKTVNHSKTWNVANVGLPSTSIQSILVLPNAGAGPECSVICSVLDEGIFKSIDGAASWEAIGVDGLDGLTLQALASSPSDAANLRMFAGSETDGLWYCSDGGQTWIQANGLEACSVNAISVSPRYESDFTLFAGTGEGGVFRSIDAGENWTRVTPAAESPSILSLVALAEPSGETLVLAGTFEDGIIRSEDGGETWTSSSQGLSSQNWLCFAISPKVDDDGIMLAGGTSSGIFKSVDGGATWSDPSDQTADLNVLDISISPSFESDKWALAATSQGLFGSRNAGDSWEQIAEEIGDAELRSVAISPAFERDRTILSGGLAGAAYLSTDGGEAFTRIGYDFSEEAVADIAFSPNFEEDGTIFVGTIGSGLVTVHKSTDKAVSFRKWVQHPCDTQWISLAIPPSYQSEEDVWFFAAESQVFKPARRLRQVWSGSHPSSRETAVLDLAASPTDTNSEILFAASSNGVWRSDDGALNWEELNHGLGNKAVLQVIPSPTYLETRTVYLLGLGGEVWRYRDIPEKRTLKQTRATDYI